MISIDIVGLCLVSIGTCAKAINNRAPPPLGTCPIAHKLQYSTTVAMHPRDAVLDGSVSGNMYRVGPILSGSIQPGADRERP